MFLRFARIAPSVLRPRSTLASPFVRARLADASAPRIEFRARIPSPRLRSSRRRRPSARSRAASTRARGARLSHALQHGHDPARVHAPVDRVLARLDDRGEIFVLRRRSSRARDRASTRRGGARGARSRVELAASTRAVERRDERRATPSARFDRRAATRRRRARARARGDGRRRDRRDRSARARSDA